MTDDTGRRERRQFEPPPWERDQFDEIARRKAEEEARLAPPRDPRDPEGPTEMPASAAGAGAGPEAVEAPAGSSEALRPATATKEAPAGIDERRIAAMLVELSGEEGSSTRPVAQAGRIAASALVVFGAVMVVLAAVFGLRTSAMQGRVGAILIALLGVFVAGFAGWMWVRANREQGS